MGGGAPESAGFVCGFLGCDARPYNPLLGALPRLFKVTDPEDGPLGAYVQIALMESKRPRIGSQSVLGRLSELMFVDVIRRYLETLPSDRLDWLAGLRDPYIGRALAEIHRNPAADWSLESLARRVAMSRSAFAEHFTKFVGTPPMQYLTNWRMAGAPFQRSAEAGFLETTGHSPTPPGSRSKKCHSVQKSSPGLKLVSDTRSSVVPSRLKTETPGIQPPFAET